MMITSPGIAVVIRKSEQSIHVFGVLDIDTQL
jgi:hypothetical protein